MSFKSRATWGSSSLNCGLSATASQIASVTANTGKECVETDIPDVCAIDYFSYWNGCFNSRRRAYYFRGVCVNEHTTFSQIFNKNLRMPISSLIVNYSDSYFDRNIAYCFLYALYLKYYYGRWSNFPAPEDFVNAYQNTTGQKRKDLKNLVAFYVRGGR
ncbi:hypothetical protein [Rheinheimera sp. MMS21-TC3]|uniref:hypothetical protein n=1 Tax=Rheinheimera sp. MMS21-TC3 TaxID=3072790 RepID=UPI0028C38878|nr:hypothetical protein [Rheinheimera sp. MMS21-TC3]WNO62194.1 hypothetical protein RDV63_14915 [Rheinheimera sp. MMS21-TC3]